MKLECTGQTIQPSRLAFEPQESPPENIHSLRLKATDQDPTPQQYRNEEKANATI